ncbi:Molecular chaperone HSP20 family, IbpA [Methanonatronarchaeum thermophilum]|uniref:Molecular chaperone HSP20 family, IbpA n=1 Tax=Methanonatronarchaeum thermophilum TaxID=1927129 RepID=A0A1Y3GD69_9EURY|nr:Hsp20/alpha crystallin family protein [Methanonatronarchaeum thermophilum]OUJ18263.1 Molecular chaperone HSP20 family, IbpA [Methanonatronarchaeum thermophilum]
MEFDPFEELKNMRERMEAMYQELGQNYPSRIRQPWREQTRGMYPNTDIMDHKNEVVVTMDLPGVQKSDINLHIDGETLTITAERQTETKKEEESYIAHERRYGNYHRTVRLPAPVNEEKINATFKNGVLEIHLPKTEKTRGKQIKIE